MAVAQGEPTPPDATKGGSSSGEPETPADLTTAAGREAAKRAAKAAEKAKKRAATAVPAEVAESVVAAKSWYDHHGRTVYAVLGTFLVIGGGLVGGHHFMSADRAEKSAVLNEAVTVANAPIIAEGEEPPEGVDDFFPTAKARAEKLLEQARAAQKAGTEGSKRWALLVEANALLQLDKHVEARKAYERLVAGGDTVPAVLRYRALEGLGFALEADKKYGEAAGRFAQIGELENGAFKVPSEYHRARMLLGQGEYKKASAVLDALLKAERNRPASEAKRFEDTVGAAGTLLDELAVALDDPKLRASAQQPTAAAGSDDIMEMIRSQLKAGKGEPSLDDKQLEKLVHELDKGGTAPAPPPAEGATK